MEITFSFSKQINIDEVIALYEKAELPRPTHDKQRMEQMVANSNLIVSAWSDEKLVGICRCITDWVWCCYLSDLVVDTTVKNSGIGRQMVELVKEKVSEHCMILLLSVPTAMDYYPKLGFAKDDRAFTLSRKN